MIFSVSTCRRVDQENRLKYHVSTCESITCTRAFFTILFSLRLIALRLRLESLRLIHMKYYFANFGQKLYCAFSSVFRNRSVVQRKFICPGQTQKAYKTDDKDEQRKEDGGLERLLCNKTGKFTISHNNPTLTTKKHPHHQPKPRMMNKNK